MPQTINMDQALRMDRMYRYQRHFYDLTRRHYLLGRDRLLDGIPISPGDLVLETGCGTARNLRVLAEAHPEGSFYGIDASSEMLRTAERKLTEAALEKVVTIRQGLAESYNYRDTFGLSEPFDLIFFSYSLSMIPAWKAALKTALTNLKSQGSLFILDFSDQRDLPVWMGKSLQKWLALFGVHYRPEFQHWLEDLEKARHGRLRVTPILRNYAFIAEFRKA